MFRQSFCRFVHGPRCKCSPGVWPSPTRKSMSSNALRFGLQACSHVQSVYPSVCVFTLTQYQIPDEGNDGSIDVFLCKWIGLCTGSQCNRGMRFQHLREECVYYNGGVYFLRTVRCWAERGDFLHANIFTAYSGILCMDLNTEDSRTFSCLVRAGSWAWR